ncbi:MAG: COX15/CtaA family protein, partial [Methylococcaceae bacterium]
MFRKLTLFGVFLTLIMVLLGSYLRLSGADQGLFLPDFIKTLSYSPTFYLTAALGLLVLLLNLLAWSQQPRKTAVITTSLALLVLVGLQLVVGATAIAAMPIVITTQVVLAMLTFGLMFGLSLRLNPAITGRLSDPRAGLGLFAQFSLLVLLLEIILGAWVSANHAALACSGFPQCNGQWWPQANYQNALNLINGLLTGYTGVISFDAQVAASWLHRVGALVSFFVLSLLMFRATATLSLKSLRTAGLWLGVLLFVQIGLAIAGVKLGMPLWATLAHHIVGALLMLPLIAISFYSRYG